MVIIDDTQMETDEKDDHENIEEGLAAMHFPHQQEHPEFQNEEDDEEEEEDDDDDEDEELGEPMTLGFVQKPEDPCSLARHFFPSKAGGTPAWLNPTNIPDGKDSCCDICGNPLQLLIQIYAPIEENANAFHRTLFVFMCPSMACLQEDQLEQRKRHAERPRRSVKVFRCQLPRKNSFYSMDPPKHDGWDESSSSGVSLCSWCGTWRGSKICSGCKQARYCSRQHQINHWQKGHAADCLRIQSSSKSVSDVNGHAENHNSSQHTNGHAAQDCLAKAASNCLWPELEVIDEEENDLDSGYSGEQVPHNSIVANPGKDGELLTQFDSMEASKDQKHWASFQAQIAKAPDQVLRYSRSRNAKILWPRLEGQPQHADIPSCAVCNGPRYFEFQVLPQLLYFFNVRNDTGSLDWSTIAIYTCAASCGENCLGYVKEFAWVQLA